MQQYEKRTQEYDAPCLVLGIEQMMDVVAQNYFIGVVKDKEMIDQLEIKLDDENFPEKGQEKKTKIYNSMITKETFEKIKNQQQYNKLNVVIYNPTVEYDDAIGEMQELFERAHDFIQQEKRLSHKNQLMQMKMGYEPYIEYFIQNTEVFDQMYQNALLTLDEDEIPMKKRKHASEVVTTVKMVRKGFDLSKMMSMMYVAFTRYEIDFSKEEINVYKSYSKVKGASHRDFKPYEHDLHECLEKTISFKEVKKIMINQLLEKQANEKIDDVLIEIKELKKEGSYEEQHKQPKELTGQTYDIGYSLTEMLSEQYMLYAMSFILDNNMIVKKIEKERVLKNKKATKKKGGGSNYKSIVKTSYVLDKERTDKMHEEAQAILERMQKERKESEYTKEQWEVKPHVRTLKDGRKIMISGQKRKRRKEILTKEEGTQTKKFKTLGMTDKDIDKMVNEATQKIK